MLQREGIAVGRTQKARASEVDGGQKLREINFEKKIGWFPIFFASHNFDNPVFLVKITK